MHTSDQLRNMHIIVTSIGEFTKEILFFYAIGNFFKWSPKLVLPETKIIHKWFKARVSTKSVGVKMLQYLVLGANKEKWTPRKMYMSALFCVYMKWSISSSIFWKRFNSKLWAAILHLFAVYKRNVLHKGYTTYHFIMAKLVMYISV